MPTHTTHDNIREEPGRAPAVACSLPPDGLHERLAWIRSEILPHARETVRLPRGLAFELAPAVGLAEKLDRLIELERDCCSGIVFERAPSAVPDRLRFEVRGIDPDAEIFRSLARQDAAAPPRRFRFMQAAGAGVLGSLFVCCVLPVAAAALLGAVAAPLASLDGPGPIAAGALVGGATAWWWLGRRRSAPRAARR